MKKNIMTERKKGVPTPVERSELAIDLASEDDKHDPNDAILSKIMKEDGAFIILLSLGQ